MQLCHATPLGHGGAQQRQLLGHSRQVGLDHLGAQLGSESMATAIPAGMTAERHMHIERQRILAGDGQLGRQIGGPNAGMEGCGGGVAGVAGHRLVVLAEQIQAAQRRWGAAVEGGHRGRGGGGGKNRGEGEEEGRECGVKGQAGCWKGQAGRGKGWSSDGARSANSASKLWEARKASSASSRSCASCSPVKARRSKTACKLCFRSATG